MAKAQVNIDRLNKDSVLTIRLNITRRFQMRLFVAKLLVRCAAFVLGCGIKILEEEEKQQ